MFGEIGKPVLIEPSGKLLLLTFFLTALLLAVFTIAVFQPISLLSSACEDRGVQFPVAGRAAGSCKQRQIQPVKDIIFDQGEDVR